MKLDIQFSNLENLKNRMGAHSIKWRSFENQLDQLDIKKILLAGKEISIDEIEATQDGLLSYKGEQVLLYIKDSNRDKETLLYDNKKAPKFHISDCVTLDTMRGKGRFDRYIVTQNTSGEFDIDYFNQNTDRERGTVKTSLDVCRNCLKFLEYESYDDQTRSLKDQIVGSFNIEAFFQEHAHKFKNLPKYTDRNAPSSGYNSDWDKKSRNYKELKKWCCETCKVDLSNPINRKYLHCHHIDGVKAHDQISNLRALCAMCHKEEPMHGHMNIPNDAIISISRLRKEQKL